MGGNSLRLLGLVLVLGLAGSPTPALIDCGNEPSWLWSIINESDIIFVGRVLGSEIRAIAPEERIDDGTGPGVVDNRWVPPGVLTMWPATDPVARVRFDVEEIWREQLVVDLKQIDIRVPYGILGGCPGPEFRIGERVIVFLQETGDIFEPVGGANGTVYPGVEEFLSYRHLVKALAPELRIHGIWGLVSSRSEWVEIGQTLAGGSPFRRDGRSTQMEMDGGFYGYPITINSGVTETHCRRFAEALMAGRSTDADAIFTSGILTGYRDPNIDSFVLERMDRLLSRPTLPDSANAQGGYNDTMRWLIQAIRYFGDREPHWRLYVHTEDELDEMEDIEWMSRIWQRAKDDLDLGEND
jgi:hypothetical protein